MTDDPSNSNASVVDPGLHKSDFRMYTYHLISIASSFLLVILKHKNIAFQASIKIVDDPM